MPAFKTFAMYAAKLQAALDFIAEEKVKRAVTILKRLQASAAKRGAKATKSGKSKSPKKLSAWSKYVKDNYARVQKETGAEGKDMLALLSAEYKGKPVSNRSSTKSSTKKASTKSSTKEATKTKKPAAKKSKA